MNKIIQFLSLFLFLSRIGAAQKTIDEEDKNRLMYLNSLYLQAYVKSDTAMFDQLLWADEFTQTNPDGSVFTRKENAVRFGEPRF